MLICAIMCNDASIAFTKQQQSKPIQQIASHAARVSDNKMYAAEVGNLYFGTGLLNNNQEIRVLDMVDLDGSNNVRMIMRFTSGVQFGIASDIVEYA